MPGHRTSPAFSRALVTGGTSGIGAAFATELAARGTDLVLVARDAERLAGRAEELRRRYGVEVETLTADLSDRDQVLLVADRIAADDDRIDLLVNNAGFGVHSALCVTDFSPHEVALDVMCRAVLILAGTAGRVFAERMADAPGSGPGSNPGSRRKPHIINVGSTAGYVTMGSYSATKAWVGVYSEGLANELAGTGVGVTVLCPGWVRTEFHTRAGIGTSKIPEPLWLEAGPLVRDALADAEAGRVISIPSARYQVLITAARLAPRSAIRAVSRRLSSGRKSH